MWKIDSNYNITMTKGDTPSFQLNLTTKDSSGADVPYSVKTSDKIIFAVKEKIDSTEILINIEVPHDTMILKIPQNKTKFLGLGKYIYEISINNDADDFHDTFVANRVLELTAEVY